MKKFILIIAVAIGLNLGTSAQAAQSAPGIPGNAQCHGQTISYLAQAVAVLNINGIGGLAKSFGVSVKEIQALVRGYCGQ